jgi:hypothetical protein
MEHTNTLGGQNAENLYNETGGTLDIKGLELLFRECITYKYVLRSRI